MLWLKYSSFVKVVDYESSAALGEEQLHVYTIRIVLIRDSFSVIDFISVTDCPNQTLALLKPNIGPRICD